MLVNSCPILNLHIPPPTVSCALPGRVDWLHCVQLYPDGWWTYSSEPFTGTHMKCYRSPLRWQEIHLALQYELSYGHILRKPRPSGGQSRGKDHFYHGRAVKGRPCPFPVRQNLRLCAGSEPVCEPAPVLTGDEADGYAVGL